MFAGSRYRKGTLGDVDAENPGVWWLRALALVLAHCCSVRHGQDGSLGSPRRPRHHRTRGPGH